MEDAIVDIKTLSRLDRGNNDLEWFGIDEGPEGLFKLPTTFDPVFQKPNTIPPHALVGLPRLLG